MCDAPHLAYRNPQVDECIQVAFITQASALT